MSNTFKALFLTGIAVILTACATGPQIFSSKDPNTDLGTFTTFAFEPKLSTDRTDGAQSLLSQFFINATRKEMELRGYKYSTDNPEILFNFYASTKEKIRTTSSPAVGGYYGYRGGFYGAYGGYDTQVQQYTQGTVTIDMVNEKTNKLVWEGTAVGRITSEVEANLQEAVTSVVNDIFLKYPTQQGGGGPYVPPKK